MATPVYVFDRNGNRVILSTPDPTPTFEQVQSWLQNPLGTSGPNSILTTNSSNILDKLRVEKIERADLDGGGF
jgi:hypothetical protein